MPFFLLQISGLYIRSTNKLPLLLPNYQDPTLWDMPVIYPHWNIQVGCKEGVSAPGWRPSYSIWAMSHSHNVVSSQRRLRCARVSQKNHKGFLVSLLCYKTRLFFSSHLAIYVNFTLLGLSWANTPVSSAPLNSSLELNSN